MSVLSAHHNWSRGCDARRCLARSGRTVGLNHTMISRLAMTFEVIAVVIRQYTLRNCLREISFGTKGKQLCGGGSSCFIIMTHINGVARNIQIFSSLFSTYLSSISENPVSSRSFNSLTASAFNLVVWQIIIHLIIPTVRLAVFCRLSWSVHVVCAGSNWAN